MSKNAKARLCKLAPAARGITQPSLRLYLTYSPVDDNDQELVPLRPPLPRRRPLRPPVVGREGGGHGGGQGEADHDQAPSHATRGMDSLAKEDHDGGGVIPNNPAKRQRKRRLSGEIIRGDHIPECPKLENSIVMPLAACLYAYPSWNLGTKYNLSPKSR